MKECIGQLGKRFRIGEAFESFHILIMSLRGGALPDEAISS
jgi:hypothetical protein